MKTSKFTVEQISGALRRVEGGHQVGEVCRDLGITEATFYRWRKKYGGIGSPALRELRQLRDENRRLKTAVADLTLDRTMLQEALRKKW
jgi:putative transposase